MSEEGRAVNPLTVFRSDLAAMADQFSAALPEHVPVERFARVIQTAVQLNPYILQCDRRTLWSAAMKAAQDGLLPDGREGALVPFQGKVVWQAMVAGIRKKARNSGEISTWDVYAVHAKDAFEFELGDEPFIRHKPTLDGDPGPVIAVYSVAKMKDGSISRDVMSVADVERIRDRSEAWRSFKAGKIKSTPWQTDFAEMAKKTIAKRHAKVLPMSTDLDDLIRGDDELYNFAEAREQAAASKERPSLVGALDQLAGTVTESAEPATGGDDASAEGDTGGEGEKPASGPENAPADDPADDADGERMNEVEAAAYDAGFAAGKKGAVASAIPGKFADDPQSKPAWLKGHAAGVAERKSEKGGAK